MQSTLDNYYRYFTRITLASVLVGLLSACGFALKQSQQLPFTTLYTNINANTQFGASLQRILYANSPDLRLVPSPEAAEYQLLQLRYQRHRRDLSLDPRGDVENYELRVTMEFELKDQHDNTIMPPTSLSIIRDIPNNPDSSYAKQLEIENVFESMELSLVDRLMRRLNAAITKVH